MTLRTAGSVYAGMTHDATIEGSRAVWYEPGNGHKYLIIVTPIEGEISVKTTGAERSVAVIVLGGNPRHGSQTLIIRDDGSPFTAAIAEGVLGYHGDEAEVVAEVVGTLIGAPVRAAGPVGPHIVRT